MKRLHNLFERYFEEAKNLKNAEKSLPDDLAIEMRKDLTAFYVMERELLSLKVTREFETSKYYEEYKSSVTIPRDVRKPFFKRIFRKVKTTPNEPAKKIKARIDAEIKVKPLRYMLNEDEDDPEPVGERIASESAEEPADGSKAPAEVFEPSDGVQSAEDVGEHEEPTRRRGRRKEPPAAGEPRLVEVQTPLGAQIKLQMPEATDGDR